MIDVVVRCRNDVSMLPGTLAGLKRQSMPLRIFAFDNASNDGSRELLAAAAFRVVDIEAGSYNPGRVLNQAMRETESPLVAFLNSDCEPVDEIWLAELVAVMNESKNSAAFGRQMPRPDCLPWFARDTEATFGDGKEQAKWRHCFSMASSIVRRSVWEEIPFREDITYSEDVDLTYRMCQKGHEIGYAPNSKVLHSHNYTWQQYFRRQFGEGKADAQIFDWNGVSRSWLRYSALPYVRQIVRDVSYCLAKGQAASALQVPYVRSAQLLGRRKGFVEGLREKS